MKPKMDALTQEFDNIIERVSKQVDDKELAERERKADEFIESVKSRARHGEEMNYNNFELEIIVRKLAESDPTNRAGTCSFCNCYLEHNPTCPWRMALNWALSHKPTPIITCYRCRLSIGPKELMDRHMIRGEEVCVHRHCAPQEKKQ